MSLRHFSTSHSLALVLKQNSQYLAHDSHTCSACLIISYTCISHGTCNLQNNLHIAIIQSGLQNSLLLPKDITTARTCLYDNRLCWTSTVAKGQQLHKMAESDLGWYLTYCVFVGAHIIKFFINLGSYWHSKLVEERAYTTCKVTDHRPHLSKCDFLSTTYNLALHPMANFNPGFKFMELPGTNLWSYQGQV